jgi:hypothetical protein
MMNTLDSIKDLDKPTNLVRAKFLKEIQGIYCLEVYQLNKDPCIININANELEINLEEYDTFIIEKTIGKRINSYKFTNIPRSHKDFPTYFPEWIQLEEDREALKDFPVNKLE